MPMAYVGTTLNLDNEFGKAEALASAGDVAWLNTVQSNDDAKANKMGWLVSNKDVSASNFAIGTSHIGHVFGRLG